MIAAGGGFGARGMNREHAVEAGDLEDSENVAIGGDERKLDRLGRERLLRLDEDSERGRVDEGAFGEIDDYRAGAAAGSSHERRLELRCRVEIKLTGNRDHARSVAGKLGGRPEIDHVFALPNPSHAGKSLAATGCLCESFSGVEG